MSEHNVDLRDRALRFKSPLSPTSEEATLLILEIVGLAWKMTSGGMGLPGSHVLIGT